VAQPRFSIGIDLGTSNSALAFAELSGAGGVEILAIPQLDTAATTVDAETLPSFLYLPENASAWVVGRLARRKAGETPGRVVQSAKSWLCHHGADRTAPFLPWGSDDLGQHEKISPVAASAQILGHLRAAWDARFADDRFDDQDITITVPASFDAVAQRLTLAAARDAGFPDRARLLEEPQAAFSAWLDQPGRRIGATHILVIDIGGGTTDFSLFALGGPDLRIERVAVSDHILLGGDNIDLAIAHRLEARLADGEAGLSAGQWHQLVAGCRALKERVLGCDGAADETFTVSIAGRGAGLIAGAASAQATRGELEALVVDGFFPDCRANDRPLRAIGAMKEWGLPYAFDGAVTRHLAEFLRDRPPVDAVLFNGGSLYPRRLRDRLCEQIGKWQAGSLPQVLENDRLDLAVARGAACFGRQLRHGGGRIKAGAARAVFLETGGKAGRRPLVCILPRGAAPGHAFDIADRDLRLRVNQPARFQVHTSTRHDHSRVGDVVDLDPEVFQALPPLETVANAASGTTIPVVLVTKVNELGLLQVSCRSLDPDIAQSWPLEFSLRPREGAPPVAAASPDVAPDLLAAAGARLTAAFTTKRDKVTATRLFQGLEQCLGHPKGEWSAILVRALWPSLEGCEANRALSVEHEEAWLILAGFLLRPGFGVAMDDGRIDSLWRIRGGGLRFPGKRIRLQDHILWRRLAGGLSRERQEALIAAETDRIFQPKSAPPELIRMAGSFERLGHALKTELAGRFIDTVVELASRRAHCAPYLAALGLLLNRTPLYAGPQDVVSPALVEQAYDAFRGFDWSDPELAETQVLFLRAARAVDDRRIDLPKSLRHRIADRLEKCGVAAVKAGRLRQAVPVERAERLNLYGEAVPPGLILGAS